jgi:hypothetical protein
MVKPDCYGVLVALGDAEVLAGLLAEAALLVLPVEVVVLPTVLEVVLVVVAGVIAGVVTTRFAFAFALLAGRLALLAASPQAMPMALRPRTVESTITFFILFRLLNLSQRFFLLLTQKNRPIEHGRLCLELFLFKANVNIVI